MEKLKLEVKLEDVKELFKGKKHKTYVNPDSQRRYGHRKATTSKNKFKETPMTYGYHTEDYKRHVVYEHYYGNEDKPFYVGEGDLQRAFVFCGKRRTQQYKDKVLDVNLVHVKIVAIDISVDDAIKLQDKLIDKYKRISEGGSLLNVDYKRGGGFRQSLAKKVYQFSLNGKYINTYISTGEAEKAVNGKRSNIANCCAGRKWHSTSSGYLWRYENDVDLSDINNPKLYPNDRYFVNRLSNITLNIK